MRVESSNPLTPAVVVKLDGEVVPGCVEADDVIGWVKRMVPAPDQPRNHPGIVYLQGREGPMTEIVKGDVELLMIKYEYDENGKTVGNETVQMDWDLYLEQRKHTFMQIHKGDIMRVREASAALDEWYGKARSQDAEARQAKSEGQEAAREAGEREGSAEGVGGQGNYPRTSHAKTATRSPSDDDTPIIT
jgi:hypothetical protein